MKTLILDKEINKMMIMIMIKITKINLLYNNKRKYKIDKNLMNTVMSYLILIYIMKDIVKLVKFSDLQKPHIVKSVIIV